MQIILIQDVNNLGGANELVSVKNGYARNFLIPKKMAIEASPSNLKQLEERLKQIKKNEDIVLIRNSPNDILNATKEMYEICMNGKKFESNNNNKEFKRIVQDSKIPYITEISNEFINNYKEIIE